VEPLAPLALALRAGLARRVGDRALAARLVDQLLAADPLDVRALHERALLEGTEGALPGGAQTALDVAHDEACAGLLDEAVDALERALVAGPERGAGPLLHYTLAWLLWRRGGREDSAAARSHLGRARAMSPAWVMPARLEEIAVLRWAIAEDPDDPRAPYYLGNLLYDRRRYAEAIELWRRAARLDPTFPTVHRNLGIAEVNVLRRPERGLAAYRRAVAADPSDARLLYELDQLRKRLAHDPAERLRALEARRGLVSERDDLTVEYVTLLVRTGRYEEAVDVLRSRRFHPWEGGEGLVSGLWVAAHRELARIASRAGDAERAASLLRTAMAYPPNLGEGKHLLTRENELQYLLGKALAAARGPDVAREWFDRAAQPQGHPDAAPGDGPYGQALALRELGRSAEADDRLHALLRPARAQARTDARIPYFATSLPTLLLFDDDLTLRARQDARYLEGLALLGLGRRRAARARFRTLLAERPDHLEAALRLAELDEG
jgi:tetratricopeptide (TPR) repeat protein